MDIFAVFAQFNLNLFSGIVAGVISGVYSGLIMARIARFYEVKAQALRLVRRIDFVINNKGLTFTRPMKQGELSLLAAELIQLQHRSAAKRFFEIDIQITTIQHGAKAHGQHANVIHELYRGWQKLIREASPNWGAILLYGRL
ncbi:MAG: hypothetical protein CML17_12000 [Pusillimonas sp.]|jgi:hypothetical protein|nr:hypothetical protein [Pusillimonas sp.]